MDSNLMSCPTCGHSVSNAAGACTYCGAMMSEEVQQSQAEDTKVEGKVQAAVSPPPLPQKESPPVDETIDEADETPSATAEASVADISQQSADFRTDTEIAEPEPEAAPETPAEEPAAEPAAESAETEKGE